MTTSKKNTDLFFEKTKSFSTLKIKGNVFPVLVIFAVVFSFVVSSALLAMEINLSRDMASSCHLDSFLVD